MLDEDRIQLWRGPRESRFRPSTNSLFRSAAVAYKERVAGVILSGTLDDGTAGLWWVKRYGGLAIVQEPGETAFPDMVLSALEHVEIDYVVKGKDIGRLLDRVADGFPATLMEQRWKRNRL